MYASQLNCRSSTGSTVGYSQCWLLVSESLTVSLIIKKNITKRFCMFWSICAQSIVCGDGIRQEVTKVQERRLQSLWAGYGSVASLTATLKSGGTQALIVKRVRCVVFIVYVVL